MTPKKSALQALSVVTTVGLVLGAAAPAGAEGAKDILTDNAHNIAGGGVNIHADNTCVEKIGDTAHVKFMAQHQPLVRSSDHGQTAAHGTLALPRAMKNVSIKIKAVGGGVKVRNDETGSIEDVHREATVFDAPLDIPILETSDEYEEKYPYGPPTLGGMQKIKGDMGEYDKESVPSVKETPDPDNPDLVRESTLWTEQEVRDFVEKYNVHMKKTPQGFVNTTVPFTAYDSGDTTAWYGTKYSKDYDLYEFGNLMMPVTFEIEGDVPVEQKDTFVTGAISNLGWKSSSESYAGSYEGGSQSLQEYPWARPNQLPPAIPKSEDMIQLYKEKLSDAGLDISPTIAPTREMPGDSKYSYIGSDIRPSARGDVGQWYTKQFTLNQNLAVTYIGQVDTSAEDGADITAAHVTLCPSEETPTTTKQLIPETETPDKETETPETETPDKETDTPETETEKEPTPSTEPKPNGSSLDEETIKKVGLGLGLGLGGSALIKKVKEHRGGSSSTEHTTQQPAPSTTKQPAPTTTVQPAPSTTAQAAPSTTEQAAPAPSTSPAPAATTSRTGTLAQTGANVTTLAVAGSLIVLAGAAFLLVGRRRKEEN